MQAVSIEITEAGTLTAFLRGELDFLRTPEVLAVVEAAIRDHRPGDIRVDLGEVTCLDSSGIGALVRTMKAADQINATFVVQHPARPVYDQLDMAGLTEVFGLYGSPGAPGR